MRTCVFYEIIGLILNYLDVGIITIYFEAAYLTQLKGTWIRIQEQEKNKLIDRDG